MIRYLVIMFFAMSLYGVFTGFIGASLLALLMAGVCIYAERHFAEQDRKWANDPANAREAKPDTLRALEQHECECMRSKDQL